MSVNHLPSAKELKKAIIKTLAFFDIFNQPLTATEVKDYLFKIKGDKSQIEQAIHNTPSIYKKSDYFSLNKDQSSPEIRHKRDQVARRYWQKIGLLRSLFCLIPYLKMVAVCNNLPLRTVDQDSDIDLFIITQKNRLFTTRFLLTFWLQLLGQRRHGQKIAGRFCLSFYITEKYLNLQNLQIKPYDIYLAYWLKTLQPIIDNGIYQKFMQANTNWLKNYFALPVVPQINYLKKTSVCLNSLKKLQEYILNSYFGEIMEILMRRWQKSRASKKKAKVGSQANIIINNDILKFHNLDRRREIYEKWRKKVKEYMSKA